jgi:DnaK suppressor protein
LIGQPLPEDEQMKAELDARVRGAGLGPAQLQHFRRQLAGQRAVLSERLGAQGRDDARLHADEPVSDAAIAQATESLDDIEAAMRRLDAGTYGWCEACHEAIPIERLEVVPAAARCVRCQAQTTSLLR